LFFFASVLRISHLLFVNEAETAACGKLHMQYDEEKDMGSFGKKIWCENCRMNEPSFASSSGSDYNSDLDSDRGQTDQNMGMARVEKAWHSRRLRANEESMKL
jgi:hypothetical protein